MYINLVLGLWYDWHESHRGIWPTQRFIKKIMGYGKKKLGKIILSDIAKWEREITRSMPHYSVQQQMKLFNRQFWNLSTNRFLQILKMNYSACLMIHSQTAVSIWRAEKRCWTIKYMKAMETKVIKETMITIVPREGRTTSSTFKSWMSEIRKKWEVMWEILGNE